jgi:hypothetical protein
MSDQTQFISEDDQILPVEPETAKKSKGKAGAAIGAGALVGLGAIAFDSYGSSETDFTSKSSEKSSDSASVAGGVTDADSTQHPQESSPVETQPVHNGVSNSADVTLIPDHVNVGNAPDNMSFSEAFALCRENLGPAAVFEWQGHLYHTCHPAEYAALPDDLKNVFDTLWVANEEHLVDFIPEQEGAMSSVSLTSDETDTQVAHETTTDSTATNPEHDFSATADSTLTDGAHQDIVYSHDDFDNNFDGADEWINPEDIA